MMTAFSLMVLNGYFSMYHVHFILIKQVAKILCVIKSSPKSNEQIFLGKILANSLAPQQWTYEK